MLRQITWRTSRSLFSAPYLTYQLAGAGMDPLATLAVIVPCFFSSACSCTGVRGFSVSPFNSLLVSFGSRHHRSADPVSGPQTSAAWNPPYGEVKFRIGASTSRFRSADADDGLALSLLTWVWLRHTYTGRRCARSPRCAHRAAFGVNVRGLSLLLRVSARPLPASRPLLALSYTLARTIYAGSAWCRRGDARGAGQSLGPLVAG